MFGALQILPLPLSVLQLEELFLYKGKEKQLYWNNGTQEHKILCVN